MSNRIVRHSCGLMLALAASGCAGPSSALDPAGPQAGRIADLWWFFLWITAAIYGLVIIAMLITLRRRNAGDGAEVIGPNPKVERGTTIVVSTCVGLSAVILFTLMIADLLTGRDLHARETNPLPIQIIGHQWWWEIQYRGGAPSNWVTTANELHIPTGREIFFDLQSHDVIHSFWFPSLNGKKDLVPGHPATAWFRADRAGEYFGQCAEFCGLQHAHMRLRLIAEEPSKFSSWYQAQQQTPPEPSGDAEKRGKQLVVSTSCVLCHKIQGTTAAATFGPDLTHVAGRHMLAAGTLTNEPSSLAQWIKDPARFKPGTKMPQNNFRDDDLTNIVAYLRTLK
jgi:cytochrome c oxidase subunit 2